MVNIQCTSFSIQHAQQLKANTQWTQSTSRYLIQCYLWRILGIHKIFVILPTNDTHKTLEIELNSSPDSTDSSLSRTLIRNMSNYHSQKPEDMVGEGFHPTEGNIDPRLLTPVHEWNQRSQPSEQLDYQPAESSPISFHDPDMSVGSSPARNAFVPQQTYQPSGINTIYIPPTSSAGGSNLGNIVDPTAPTFSQAGQTFYQPAPTSGQNVPKFGQIGPNFGQGAPSSGQTAPIAGQPANPYNLHFLNSAQAQANMPADIWTCPRNDATWPSSLAEREAWVEKLLDAICNVHNVEDRADNAFKASWFDPTTGVYSNSFSMEDKEDVAWKIVELAVNLHGRDSSVLHSLDQETLWKHARATQDWTFKERMERIVQLLTRSKSRCEMLLSDTGFHAVVGNPAAMLSALVINSKENDQRQAHLTSANPN